MTHAQQLKLRSGLQARVLSEGSGPPLVFLHGHLGCRWDPFLAALSRHYTVLAPQHPGSEDPDELMQLDAFSDLVLYYDDLFRALGVERPVIVGHSFGGMVAAEFAAYFPEKLASLVLIDALGLWRDDEPVTDITGIATQRVPAVLCADPSAEGARDLFALPEDPAEKGTAIVARMLFQAAVSHFIWPIPDRDLRRRLYRITAPTLLIWGLEDRYVPPLYADEFARGLPQSQSVLIDGAGHFPQVETPEAVLKAVTDFLSSA